MSFYQQQNTQTNGTFNTNDFLMNAIQSGALNRQQTTTLYEQPLSYSESLLAQPTVNNNGLNTIDNNQYSTIDNNQYSTVNNNQYPIVNNNQYPRVNTTAIAIQNNNTLSLNQYSTAPDYNNRLLSLQKEMVTELDTKTGEIKMSNSQNILSFVDISEISHPYFPPSFIDFPNGLTDVEVEEFLEEQRSDDLTGKLARKQYEIPSFELRGPEPPMKFDVNGKPIPPPPIEQRVKTSMTKEYTFLIYKLLKSKKLLTPPSNYIPPRFIKKITIPETEYPQENFKAIILGARGVNHQRLEEKTGVTISIRGLSSNYKTPFQNEDGEWVDDTKWPTHVHLLADCEEKLKIATDEITPLLDPFHPKFHEYKDYGRRELDIIQGKINIGSEKQLNKQVFESTGQDLSKITDENGEIIALSDEQIVFAREGDYRVNVTCLICGDSSHPTIDCPLGEEGLKRKREENEQMERDYEDLMNSI